MSDFSIQIIDSRDEILKYLQIGTKIPVFPEFHVYIKSDLDHFKAKSILLKEKGNLAGHTLIYSIDQNCLYFGFFGVLNDREEKIDFLTKSLINFAKKGNYKYIKGPINIPTIIYGWGFMEEGSLESLFIGKPVNSPNYIEIFLKNNFSVDTIEFALEGEFPSQLSKKIKQYNFTDYEIFYLKNWDELSELKKVFLDISIRNMASESVITPDHLNVFNNYLDFVMKYGECFMFNFVRYKKTRKIIGCMAGIPNPFRKNEKGTFDSFNFFTFTVDKEHRNKGLGWLICDKVFKEANKRGYNYFSSPVESRQKVINLMASKVAMPSLRTHKILKYKI